jgi:hypothetical protein
MSLSSRQAGLTINRRTRTILPDLRGFFAREQQRDLPCVLGGSAYFSILVVFGYTERTRIQYRNFWKNITVEGALSMGKQPSRQKRSGPGRQIRTQMRRSKKQSTTGLWLLLIGILLALGVWALIHIPPGFLIAGGILVLVILLLLLIIRFALCYRLTPEEQQLWEEQQTQAKRMEVTAQAIGSRPVEIQDLAHLGDKEFERFTGALLETMGVAWELECVGGAGDGGIDLRGKDRFNRLFIVQCKRLFGRKGGKVTAEQARGFRGAMNRSRAGEAWFVTTSSFTQQAADEVSDLTSISTMVLVDGQRLITFLHEQWDALPAQWRWRLTECMLERDRQRIAQ